MDHRGKTHTGLRVATFFVGFFLPVFTWGWGCIPELNWGGFSKNSQRDPPRSSQKVIKGPKEPEEVGGGFTLLFLFFFFFSFTPFFLPSHWGHPIRRASQQYSDASSLCSNRSSLNKPPEKWGAKRMISRVTKQEENYMEGDYWTTSLYGTLPTSGWLAFV